MPAYTVAIPVRDGQATIGEVIAAAKRQKPAPKSILVCDDGSKDESAAIASQAGANVLTHEKSLGLAAARNTLWKACRTGIIVYFDADAIAQPGCINALLAPFQNEKVGAAGGQGIEMGSRTFADRWRARTTPQSHGEKVIDDDWMVMGLCCAFRLAALSSVGGFDDQFTCCGEDVDVSLRLRREDWQLVYQPDAVVEHARSDNALGLLRQAYLHSHESARALNRQRESVGFLYRDTAGTLVYALKQGLKNLDGPAALLSVANLAARMAGLWIGQRR